MNTIMLNSLSELPKTHVYASPHITDGCKTVEEAVKAYMEKYPHLDISTCYVYHRKDGWQPMVFVPVNWRRGEIL